MSTSSATGQSLVRWNRASTGREALLTLASAAWTAAFAGYRLQLFTPAGSHRLLQIALYAWPAALLVGALLDRSRSFPLRLAAGWCTLVVVAFVAGPKMVSSPRDALAVPALVIATILAARWPTLMVLIGVAVSSAFGDLEVYWHFPTQKVIDAILVGLLLATVGSLARGRRSVAPRPLLLVLAGYLFVTAVMVPLAPSKSIGLHDFSTTAFYLVTALVIAHAGWSEQTYSRIARGVMIAALLVGAYATLRMIIGPSVREFAGNQSPFDYVNGHYRAIGSFHAPQDLALWTSAVLPFTLAWALGSKGRWRAVGLAATLLLAIALYGSGVRIGVVAAAVGIILVLLLHHFAKGFPGLRLGTMLAALILVVGTAALLFSVVHSTSPTHSYSALLHPLRDPSVIERQAKWSEAIRELRGHPFGYGMGSAYYTQAANGQAATNIGYYAIDDGYLFVALEQGLVVMALFIAGLLAVGIELGRGSITTRNRVAATLGIGAAGVLISIMVSAIAETPGQSPRLLTPCIILGLGLAQFTSRRREAPRTAH